MRKTFVAAVTVLTLGAFAAPAFAMGGCGGGHKTAGTYTEIASADQTSKPVEQTPIPTEQAQ